MFYIDSDINSLESEGTFLNLVVDEVYSLINKLQKLKEKQPDNKYSQKLIQALHAQLIIAQQDFLNLVSPEVVALSEQYISFTKLKNHYNKFLENNKDKKNNTIEKKINEGSIYFSKFEGICQAFINSWKEVTDFEMLDIKIDIYVQLTKIIEHDEKMPLISPLDVLKYQDRINSNEISLDELKNDFYYKIVRHYLYFFYKNKELINNKITNYVLDENNVLHHEDAKTKLEWMINIYKYHAAKINNLYQKNYASIPQRLDMQTFIKNLENLISAI
jgi:hypothetical protein